MKKIIIILVIIICFFLIGSIIFFKCESIQRQKIIIKNKEILRINKERILNLELREKELEKQVEEKDQELRDNINLNKLTVEQKDNLIIRYRNEIKKQDKIIKEYQEISKEKGKIVKDELIPDLEKSTKLLENNLKGHGFCIYVMPGIMGIKNYLYKNRPIEFGMIIGADYIKYFFNERIGLSVGGWVQPFNDFDFGGKLGFIFNFKKKK